MIAKSGSLRTPQDTLGSKKEKLVSLTAASHKGTIEVGPLGEQDRLFGGSVEKKKKEACRHPGHVVHQSMLLILAITHASSQKRSVLKAFQSLPRIFSSLTIHREPAFPSPHLFHAATPSTPAVASRVSFWGGTETA
jgi:hypothetical protein